MTPTVRNLSPQAANEKVLQILESARTFLRDWKATLPKASSPEMPSYAHLIFHWSVINKYEIPKPLRDRAEEIKLHRQKTAEENPNDAENWFLLAQAHQLLGQSEESASCMQKAQGCELSESISSSTQAREELAILMVRQEASLLMWHQDYRGARSLIDKLFNGRVAAAGSKQDIALRAALEMYAGVSASTSGDLKVAAEHYLKAICDLELAKPLHPAVFEVCQKSLKKRLAAAVLKLANLPEMPGYAYLSFHWAAINRCPVPKFLNDLATQIRIARIRRGEQDPNDAENLILLAQALQLQGQAQLAVRFLNIAQNCEIPESTSTKAKNEVKVLTLRQKASMLMAMGNYKGARTTIDTLFDGSLGGASLQDVALRAALEIYDAVSAFISGDLTSAVEHYTAAKYDLEAASLLDPVEIGVCLRAVQKRLVFVARALREQQALMSNALHDVDEYGIPELKSVVIRVDLASGFGRNHMPLSSRLSLMDDKLRTAFLYKTMMVNQLERFPPFTEGEKLCIWGGRERVDKNGMLVSASILSFLTYKVLHASDRVGLFTSRTNMRIVLGNGILARSQNSLLYAMRSRGPSGQLWADRLKRGMCFGGTTEWLWCTLQGNGQDYFDQLDKAVRNLWDDRVRALFRDVMVFQHNPQRGPTLWHMNTGLARWQTSVIVCDQHLFTEYLLQLSSHNNIGVLCTRGESNEGHVVGAVIKPSDTEGAEKLAFARYYNFNEEKGDLIAKTAGDLAEYITQGLTKFQGPMTVQLYGLESETPPPLAPESNWIKEMGELPEDVVGDILDRVDELDDEALSEAWAGWLLQRFTPTGNE